MSKPLIRRTTALTDAFLAATEAHGIDTSKVKLPRKTEPSWSVSRKRRRKR